MFVHSYPSLKLKVAMLASYDKPPESLSVLPFQPNTKALKPSGPLNRVPGKMGGILLDQRFSNWGVAPPPGQSQCAAAWGSRGFNQLTDRSTVVQGVWGAMRRLEKKKMVMHFHNKSEEPCNLFKIVF